MGVTCLDILGLLGYSHTHAFCVYVFRLEREEQARLEREEAERAREEAARQQVVDTR